MTDGDYDRRTVLRRATTGLAGFAGVLGATGSASALTAYGDGAHALDGFPPEALFEFDTDYVECRVERVFVEEGTGMPGPIGEVPTDMYFEMDMVSEEITSVDVDGNEVTINEGVTGNMYSKTVLEPENDPDAKTTLHEGVPFETFAEDNVLGALNDGDEGDDYFETSVVYDSDASRDNPLEVNQYDLYGEEITFGGWLTDGDNVIAGL